MSLPIIRSLLDTDLYKFSMQQAILHRYPEAEAKFLFHCRGQQDLVPLVPAICEQIEMLSELRMSEAELDYLGQLEYLTNDYIHFMRLFRIDPRYIKVEVRSGKLYIEAKGPWLHVTHFEIFVLSIISELYSRQYQSDKLLEQGRERLQGKIDLVKSSVEQLHFREFTFSDYGTRRRFSRSWHEEVLKVLKAGLGEIMPGTSNVDLARRLNLRPVGTVAHEWMQAHQALGARLIDSQKAAMESWVKEYRGNLGIALTDVIGMDAFVRDFDLYFSKLYDGLRHDSGDPIVWGEKAIALYQSMGIEPSTKRLIFSDSLDVKKATELYLKFYKRIKVSFGIGTNLTNDLSSEPLNIVMKMVECNGQPVAKISDSPGKSVCRDLSYIQYLKQVFST